MKKFCESFYDEKTEPLVTVATHSGHELRKGIQEIIALNDKQRLREEDPYTDEFSKISKNRIIVNRSRFEVDLNRKRKSAIYISSDDAWGLYVWKKKPSKKVIQHSLRLYDQFYKNIENYLKNFHKHYGYSLIYELHSFNFQREKYKNKEFPDIIIGTGKINRERWLPAIRRLIKIFESTNFNGRKLKVGENSIFPGGNFSAMVTNRFPQKSCSLAIEIKKFFMDEFSGELYPQKLKFIVEALKRTITPVVSEIEKIVKER